MRAQIGIDILGSAAWVCFQQILEISVFMLYTFSVFIPWGISTCKSCRGPHPWHDRCHPTSVQVENVQEQLWVCCWFVLPRTCENQHLFSDESHGSCHLSWKACNLARCYLRCSLQLNWAGCSLSLGKYKNGLHTSRSGSLTSSFFT